jgi:hypothetical protein
MLMPLIGRHPRLTLPLIALSLALIAGGTYSVAAVS